MKLRPWKRQFESWNWSCFKSDKKLQEKCLSSKQAKWCLKISADHRASVLIRKTMRINCYWVHRAKYEKNQPKKPNMKKAFKKNQLAKTLIRKQWFIWHAKVTLKIKWTNNKLCIFPKEIDSETYSVSWPSRTLQITVSCSYNKYIFIFNFYNGEVRIDAL